MPNIDLVLLSSFNVVDVLDGRATENSVGRNDPATAAPKNAYIK